MSKATFHKWWAKYRGFDGEPGSEAVWQYFHREFPREAALSDREKLVIGDQFRSWCANQSLPKGFEYLPAATILEWFFERLWNGDQESGCSFCLGTGECQGGDACHGNQMHDCPICKGTGEVCPTCGDSREVKVERCEVISWCKKNSIEPCPDCTGEAPIYQRKIGDEHYSSPNQRKGDRRVHVRRGNDTVYGYREAIEFKGRRTGKDRRRGEAE